MHTLTTTWPICSSIAVILRRALTCPGRRPRAARMRMQRWPISNSTSVAALFPSSLTMQQSTLLAAFGVDFAIQVAGWLIAVVLKTDKTYDMFGSATFFSISLLTLALGGPASWRAALVSACVCAWAARLGTFLVVRVHKVGHDSRLQPYIDKPGSFLVLWLVQGMWVFVTLLPVLLLNTTPTAASVVWSDVAGPLLWAVGFTIESVADWQKFVFKMDPANKGRFIDSGRGGETHHDCHFIKKAFFKVTVARRCFMYRVVEPVTISQLLW